MLAVFALAIVALLAGYSPPDKAHGAARSLFGGPGVLAAEALYHSLGYTAWLFVAPLAGWGWRIGTHHGLSRPVLRIAMVPVAVFLTAVALAALWPLTGRELHTWFAGGVTGDVLYANLVPTLGGLTGMSPTWAGILLAILAFGALLFALEVEIGLRGGVARSIALAERAVDLYHDIDDWRHERREARADARAAAEAEAAAAAKAEAEQADKPAAGRTTRATQGAARRARMERKKKAPAHQTSTDSTLAKAYELPPLDLLAAPAAADDDDLPDEDATAENARRLEAAFAEFGVQGRVVNVRPGPVVTLFEYEPAPGTKASRVTALTDDLARSMSAVSARISSLPGRKVLGIEIPNEHREIVSLRELFEADGFDAGPLTLAVGKDIGGAPVFAELGGMPHLLIAGTTGSGKSVGINTMILSLLFRRTPLQCRFIMIDPKMLELTAYNDIPHLLAPVVTDPDKAVAALQWTVREMEHRYKVMSSLGVRNIEGYNARIAEMETPEAPVDDPDEISPEADGVDTDEANPEAAKAPETPEAPAAKTLDPMPHIVVVVDEIADLMLTAGKEVETSIQRIAQLARAAGIHLIMATQRPSADVITGTIKANFPTRISFRGHLQDRQPDGPG